MDFPRALFVKSRSSRPQRLHRTQSVRSLRLAPRHDRHPGALCNEAFHGAVIPGPSQNKTTAPKIVSSILMRCGAVRCAIGSTISANALPEKPPFAFYKCLLALPPYSRRVGQQRIRVGRSQNKNSYLLADALLQYLPYSSKENYFPFRK